MQGVKPLPDVFLGAIMVANNRSERNNRKHLLVMCDGGTCIPAAVTCVIWVASCIRPKIPEFRAFTVLDSQLGLLASFWASARDTKGRRQTLRSSGKPCKTPAWSCRRALATSESWMPCSPWPRSSGRRVSGS